MSNLATVYANNVGVKLSPTPYNFITNYIPVPEKYITIYTGGSSSSVIYDHFNKVLELLGKVLTGIQIIQIGIPNDYKIDNSLDYRGKTNFRQTAFIIENSLLHIGNDSVWNHVAGSKNIPFVCPCGPTPASSITPFYHKDFIILETPDKNIKPSYSAEGKEIHSINPEEVSSAIAKLLNIQWNSWLKTIQIGKFYKSKQIDYIPNFSIGPELSGSNVAIRMDLCNNYKNLISFLSMYRAPVVVADPLPPDIIDNFKHNIVEIIYFCDDNFNIQFIKKLHSSGIKYCIITEKTGDDLSALKLKLLDFNPPLSKVKQDTSLITNNSVFSSNRLYLGKGRYYPSLYHYKNNQDVDTANYNVADYFNDPDFLEAFDNYYFYEYTI